MAVIWKPQLKLEDVKILEQKQVYSGYCPIEEYKIQFRLFNGEESIPVKRELILRPKVAAVLLYDPNTDQVVLIEQIRVGALKEPDGPWLLDVVAGLVDEGETTEQAAYREAMEEAGCEILSLIPIITYLVSVGISDEKTSIYCGLIKAPEHGRLHGLLHDGEDIKVHVVSADNAFELMKNGKILPASAVIALQWLELNRAFLRVPR